MEVSGRRVLVTGASRGLGRALVLACARAGAHEVVAGARRTETLAARPDEPAALFSRIRPVRLDVTREEDVLAAAELGRVDILINNAGSVAFGGVFKAEMEDLTREIEVNYFGVLRMVRAFAPDMVENGDGLIVNVASQLGKVSLPVIGTYCATKAALLSLSQAMRGDLAGTGVRVISVLPSALNTDMTRDFDISKMPTDRAADEIIEAIKDEAIEAPIGDEARQTLADLANDPIGLEKRLAQFRA